ncbi:hypothetical protein ACFVIM_10215 [Streptomyces sp. NPDC057638]|uniref:hypothetical protein n=1 Tax=Streptomyces sp. NPDC057638 TaxID=3346190 RepID=UPI0036981A86
MTEPNPYRADGEPEYHWGPEQTAPYPQSSGAGAGPSYGYPPVGGPLAPVPGGALTPAHPPMGAMPLVTIGDISVVQDAVITPAGTLPLKGAVWNATDMSRTEEKIPTYAIVLAVVFAAACLLGLLFLLIKEKKTTGFIQVSVTSGGVHHATLIPAQDPYAFQAIMGQVTYARSLSVQ